jgi:hypothetical protein
MIMPYSRLLSPIRFLAQTVLGIALIAHLTSAVLKERIDMLAAVWLLSRCLYASGYLIKFNILIAKLLLYCFFARYRYKVIAQPQSPTMIKPANPL